MTKSTLFLTSAMALALSGWAAQAAEVGPLKLSGYLRQDFSFNMADLPETANKDDQWSLSMNRQTAFLEAFAPVGETRWTGRVRAVNEFLTPYERRLQTIARGVMGPGVEFKDEYNEVAMRELFFDWDYGRLSTRIGKQQVVWGETDFFHATDVIHGYDFRWRHTLEPANEDIRKPLTLINATLDAKELDGTLQLVFRPPGIDKDEDVGNSDPTFGGRWSNNGSKGLPFISHENPALVPYNYNWRNGDVDNPHYGARWAGSIGNGLVDYSLSYYHGQSGFQQSAILIPGGNGPIGLEYVLPETDTFGISATGYIGAIDSVYRAEVAYTPDRYLGSLVNGLVQEDGYNIVLGLDHTLRLEELVGTSSPSMFTVQAFDWYLPGVDKADTIVRFDGAGFYKEHNVYATAILQLPYLHDTLTVTLVGLIDVSNGGGMFIPSAEYAIGDRWRLKVEADLPIGGTENLLPNNGTTFGALANNQQLLLRTTYLY